MLSGRMPGFADTLVLLKEANLESADALTRGGPPGMLNPDGACGANILGCRSHLIVRS